MRLEILHGVVARHELARDRLVFLRKFRHLLFDGDEILGRERPLVRKVVVETVLDHRTDRHLRIGKEFLDRVRKQMGGRMTQQVEAVGVAVGDDGEVRVAVDRERGVDELAVDFARQRGFGKSRADRGGDLGDRDRRVEVFDGAVGQSDIRHGQNLSGSTPFSIHAKPERTHKKSADEPHFFAVPQRANSLPGQSVSVRVRGVITMLSVLVGKLVGAIGLEPTRRE